MEKQVDKKFIWVTKSFPSLQSEKTYSAQFSFGDGKCRFVVHRIEDDYLSLSLDVVSISSEFRRETKFSFTIVNQVSKRFLKLREPQHVRIGDDQNPKNGFRLLYFLGKFKAKTGGFIVNGEVTIASVFGYLQVLAKLDGIEESEETTNPVKRIKLIDHGTVSIDLQKETMDVNGVQVLPSQMEFVSRLFEKHPDIALVFHSKNPHLRTGYINILLSLTKKLGQSPQELSNDDLLDASIALTYMTDGGFKMDWLGNALEKVKEKKKKEEACLARLRESEEELKPLKQKYLELEAQVDKEKAELLEVRAPLSFDNWIRVAMVRLGGKMKTRGDSSKATTKKTRSEASDPTQSLIDGSHTRSVTNREKCYKKHGFPPGFGRAKKPVAIGTTNLAVTPSFSVPQPTPVQSSEGMSKEQIQSVISYLSTQLQSSTITPSLNPVCASTSTSSPVISQISGRVSGNYSGVDDWSR
ncbi:hypothetical protein AALP_AA5G228400 [Arabis alpina]|uniref:MATH domain-containing protein n=1 Tax=Arabis alpina TaxID=50452 RepID=A0A087GYV1_ARAAL|nr:hypothetical protein AALP_AA5G228400 [Arabis alpina]